MEKNTHKKILILLDGEETYEEHIRRGNYEEQYEYYRALDIYIADDRDSKSQIIFGNLIMNCIRNIYE